MSDLQTVFDEYSAEHGHAPNATQLARVASIKYREASLFLRAIKNERSNTKPRSQTITTYTKPTKATFSSPKVRTSSFSEEVLYGDENKASSSSAVDYSGSTTGANNPWKKYQKKSKSSNTFSPSFMSTKPISIASTTKKQDVSPSKAAQAVSPLQPKQKPVKKKRDKRSMPKSIPSFNISALQSDVMSLNKRYERECKDIRRQFEEIRSDLTKKENQIITNLTKYTNECKAILERNIDKMEKQDKSVRNEEKEPDEYVDIEDVIEVDEAQETEKKEAPIEVVQSTVSRSSMKTFAPIVSNPTPDVDSDEWSHSDEASW